MKKWLTLSLALVAAAVTQAVTIAWTVPKSNYSWSDDIGSAYFVYSATEIEDVADVAATTANKVTATLTADPLSSGEYGAWGTYSSDLPDQGTSYYLYLVVVGAANTDATGLYAVAGLQVPNTSSDTKNYGVLDTSYGDAPDAMTYFDEVAWLGGTWTAATVPEPTILAFLALGVAGVALRRKQNFTK